ncbi:MAG: tetratricopeptide repeat protein [Alistipes sp.]
MAKEHITKPEEETLGAAMTRAESFFEENSKKVVFILIGLLVLAALIFGYKKLISEPRISKAAELIAEAQTRFGAEDTDYKLALEGDANGVGFLDVVEQYGSTPAGNLAAQYAGICYFKLGDMENAAKYLAKYSAVKGIPGAIINAQNLGLQGDIAVEQKDYAKAVSFYDKAVKAADNDLTTPMYLRKAGLAERAQGNNEKAKVYFEKILSEHPASMDAREADKLIGNN